jgi:hypothetical protein
MRQTIAWTDYETVKRVIGMQTHPRLDSIYISRSVRPADYDKLNSHKMARDALRGMGKRRQTSIVQILCPRRFGAANLQQSAVK